MLKLHQIIGYLTLAGMVTQGFLGGKLYNNWERGLYRTHKTVGNKNTSNISMTNGINKLLIPITIGIEIKKLNKAFLEVVKIIAKVKRNKINKASILFKILTLLIRNKLKDNGHIKDNHVPA